MDGKRAGKLLLVEDEHLLRGLIAQFLRGEGFESSRPPTDRRESTFFRDHATVRCRFARPQFAALSAASRSAGGSRANSPSSRSSSVAPPSSNRTSKTARAERRTVPDQALSSAGSAGSNRRRDVGTLRAPSPPVSWPASRARTVAWTGRSAGHSELPRAHTLVKSPILD